MNLRIKEILKDKQISMEELASTLDITRATLTRNINGNPTINTLYKIAKVLNVDITDLFRTNNPNKLTGLIEVDNKFYKANNMNELKEIMMILENRGIVYYNLWSRGEFYNLHTSNSEFTLNIDVNDRLFLEECENKISDAKSLNLWLSGMISSYVKRRSADNTDYLLEYYTDWLVHTKYLIGDSYDEISEWCNNYSNFIISHFQESLELSN